MMASSHTQIWILLCYFEDIRKHIKVLCSHLNNNFYFMFLESNTLGNVLVLMPV